MLVIAAVFAPLLSIVIFSGTPCKSMARSKKARAGVISLGAQQEVNGVAVAIDRPIQVLPMAADLDVGFVYSPASTDRALAPTKHRRQHRKHRKRPVYTVLNRTGFRGGLLA